MSLRRFIVYQGHESVNHLYQTNISNGFYR
nr:MAG TPA: hypothetical protein [Caudoviricetes sp.]